MYLKNVRAKGYLYLNNDHKSFSNTYKLSILKSNVKFIFYSNQSKEYSSTPIKEDKSFQIDITVHKNFIIASNKSIKSEQNNNHKLSNQLEQSENISKNSKHFEHHESSFFRFLEHSEVSEQHLLTKFRPHEHEIASFMYSLMKLSGTLFISPEDRVLIFEKYPNVTQKDFMNLLRRIKFVIRHVNQLVTEKDLKFIHSFLHKKIENYKSNQEHKENLEHKESKVYNTSNHDLMKLRKDSLENTMNTNKKLNLGNESKNVWSFSKKDIHSFVLELKDTLPYTKQQLFILLEREIEKQCRKLISKEDINLISKTYKENQNINISQLCDIVSKQIQLPRKQILELFQKEILKNERKNVTEDQKEYIQKIINENPHETNIKLCKKAKDLDIHHIITSLSGSMIHELIRKEKQKLNRKEISSEEREQIRKKIHEHLYSIFSNNITKNAISSISQDTQMNISEDIFDSSTLETSNLVSLVCDQLSSIQLPRNQLYFIVSREIRSLKKVTLQHKRFISEYVKNNNVNLKNITQICDNLESKIDLPRSSIYKLILTAVRKIETKKIPNELKEKIHAFVEMHFNDLSLKQLCDALEIETQYPRIIIYEMVTRSINQHIKLQLNEELINKFNTFMEINSLISPKDLADQIQKELQINRFVTKFLLKEYHHGRQNQKRVYSRN